ncbi:MAG: SdrD B-like domain-containing protein [Caldilineaceae bacterium]
MQNRNRRPLYVAISALFVLMVMLAFQANAAYALRERAIQQVTETSTPIVATSTSTATETATETASPSATASETSSPTSSPTETASATTSPTETLTETPTETATETASPSPTASATSTPTSQASITIIKDAQPDSIQDFTFYGPFGSVALDDDGGASGGDNTLDNTYTFNVPAGNINISEAMHPSWYLADATCTSGNGTLQQRTLSLTVSQNDSITCTFVNQRRAEITTTVFIDQDGNGQLGSGEPGVPGFEVRLYDTNDVLVKRFVSGNNGEVNFTRLIPAQYSLCLLLRAQDGSENSSGDLTISNPDLQCQSVSLQPGDFADVNFALTSSQAGTPTVTSTPTETSSPTATETETPTPTDTPTNTPTETSTPTATDTPTGSPTATGSPTETDTPTPTNSPTETETPTPTASPTETETPEPTQTATLTPTVVAFGPSQSFSAVSVVNYGRLVDINEAAQEQMFLPLLSR